MLLFDPTNAASAAYNPLLEVRRGEWEVSDVQNVADILVDPEGALERRNHWEKTSHSLLVGAILHVLYAEADKTLAGVASFLSDPRRPIETTLLAMMTTPHLGKQGPHPVVASAARELLNKSDNERSGVLSTAMSFLGLYRDPVVAQVTRRCDWRIADFVDGARAGDALSRCAALGHQPHEAAHPPGPQPDRSAPDRGPEGDGDSASGPADARRIPGARPARFLRVRARLHGRLRLKSFLIAQSLNQIEKAYGAEQLDPRQLPRPGQLRHQ